MTARRYPHWALFTLTAFAGGCFYSFQNPVGNQAPGSIAGRLVLTNPAPGQTTLGASAALGFGNLKVPLSADGNFLFLGVAPGTFDLLLQLPAAASNESAFVLSRPGVSLPFAAEALNLGDLSIAPAGTLVATLSDASGPVSVAIFAPGDGGGLEPFLASLDAGGQASATLPAGEHLVVASSATSVATALVQISGGSVTQTALALQPAAGVSAVEGQLVFTPDGLGASASEIAPLLVGLTATLTPENGGALPDAGFSIQAQLPGAGAAFAQALVAGGVYTLTLRIGGQDPSAKASYPPLVLPHLPAVAGTTVQLGNVLWASNEVLAGQSLDSGGGDGGLTPDAGTAADAGATADGGVDGGAVKSGDAGPEATCAGILPDPLSVVAVTQAALLSTGRPCYALGIDSIGNVYVTSADQVLEYSPFGQLLATAGSGVAGYLDGDAGTAQFAEPVATAVTATGTVLIADTGNHVIRAWVPATGQVTTYFGTVDGGFLASDRGPPAPQGLALDADGGLFVGDGFNDDVVRIDAAAASATQIVPFMQNANFTAIALDDGGSVYAVDSNDGKVERVDATGVVSNVANVPAVIGQYQMTGAAVSNGLLFVSGQTPPRLWVVDPGTGFVSERLTAVPEGQTAALQGGLSGVQANASGLLALASGDLQQLVLAGVDAGPLPSLPATLVLGPDSGFIQDYGAVAEFQGKFVLASSGLGLEQLQGVEGGKPPAGASGLTFGTPVFMSAAGNGTLTVVDQAATAIWQIPVAGPAVEIVDGGPFRVLSGAVVDPNGTIFVSDLTAVRAIDPQTFAINLVAGSDAGFVDAKGASAQFYGLSGIAEDDAGVLYVSDRFNGAVRRIDPQGNVVTLATGLVAPVGIAVTTLGQLIVADLDAHTLYRVDGCEALTPVYFEPGLDCDSVQGCGLWITLASDGQGGVLLSDPSTSRVLDVSLPSP